MTESLDYVLNNQWFLGTRRKTKGHFVRKVSSSKDAYREILDMVNSVQPNWGRIMMTDLGKIDDKNRVRFWSVQTFEDQYKEDLSLQELDKPMLLYSGEEVPLESIYEKLRNKFTSSSILKSVVDAIEEAVTSAGEVAGRAISSEEATLRNIESTIQRAMRLEHAGYIDSSLDLIYDSIDELMRNNKFYILDSLLSTLSCKDLSLDIILSILTATLPAKSNLSYRSTFFNRAKGELEARSEYQDDLFVGLED